MTLRELPRDLPKPAPKGIDEKDHRELKHLAPSRSPVRRRALQRLPLPRAGRVAQRLLAHAAAHPGRRDLVVPVVGPARGVTAFERSGPFRRAGLSG